MNNQKGNTSLLITIIGVLIVAGAGYFMYQSTTSKPTSESSTMESESDSMMKDDAMMEGEAMDDGSYMGTQLAGNDSPYYDFNKSDYEKALDEGKIVFLEYYADWCPICRAEQPDIEAGFDALSNPDIVGFRVNYNDTKTDDYEEALAAEHGITYQHTKVILKNGEVVLKDGEVWNTEDFKKNINSVL